MEHENPLQRTKQSSTFPILSLINDLNAFPPYSLSLFLILSSRLRLGLLMFLPVRIFDQLIVKFHFRNAEFLNPLPSSEHGLSFCKDPP
jgi:hypothetical protein